MSETDSYWSAPARNFKTSTRLHLQHYLAQNSLGHVLSPEVESFVSRGHEVKIADLACGNGAWLISLHSELSKNGISAQLDGYDINTVYFPHAAYLPSSMSLKKLDVLAKPLPPELIGVYDVVHVRAVVSIIIESDLTPLLSTVAALLRPGGYLQWEESRSDVYVVESPSPEISTTACETILEILKGSNASRRNQTGWVEVMDQHLKKHDFEDARMDVTELRRQDFKAWTENFLAWWEDLDVYFPSKAEQSDAPMTREAWLGLFSRAIEETQRGVVVHMGTIRTAVGRKAL